MIYHQMRLLSFRIRCNGIVTVNKTFDLSCPFANPKELELVLTHSLTIQLLAVKGHSKSCIVLSLGRWAHGLFDRNFESAFRT